jgi:geranylgeranyl transferase type-1 subunit beta
MSCESADAHGFHRGLHERLVRGLMRRLPAEVEAFHSQRLLLLYFAVVGGDVLALDDGPSAAASVSEELRRCYDSVSGGFCPVRLSDFTTTATLTMTHCALRVLEAVGALDNALRSWLPASKVAEFVTACHVQTGNLAGGFAAFPGSAEVDVRFTYSALMALRGVGLSVREAGIDGECVTQFLLRSVSVMDGGFASVPGGAEAHGGMTFCGVASLCLLGRLHEPDLADLRRRLKRYCVMRVGTSFCDGAAGAVGIQGRPNKPCDTCYTYWVGCSLAMLGVGWSDEAVEGTVNFALACQDTTSGGIAKEEDACSDPMHTCLALSGLAVIAPGHLGLRQVDPRTGAT